MTTTDQGSEAELRRRRIALESIEGGFEAFRLKLSVRARAMARALKIDIEETLYGSPHAVVSEAIVLWMSCIRYPNHRISTGPDAHSAIERQLASVVDSLLKNDRDMRARRRRLMRENFEQREHHPHEEENRILQEIDQEGIIKIVRSRCDERCVAVVRCIFNKGKYSRREIALELGLSEGDVRQARKQIRQLLLDRRADESPKVNRIYSATGALKHRREGGNS